MRRISSGHSEFASLSTEIQAKTFSRWPHWVVVCTENFQVMANNASTSLATLQLLDVSEPKTSLPWSKARGLILANRRRIQATTNKWADGASNKPVMTLEEQIKTISE
jgi:hypothetical protein